MVDSGPSPPIIPAVRMPETDARWVREDSNQARCKSQRARKLIAAGCGKGSSATYAYSHCMTSCQGPEMRLHPTPARRLSALPPQIEILGWAVSENLYRGPGEARRCGTPSYP